MESIAIFPVVSDDGGQSFRAVSKSAQSEGRTAGEALDAVTSSLTPGNSGTVVVIQPMLPDTLFTAEQRSRLGKLLELWRTARDEGHLLAPAEEAELQGLVEAELAAATERGRHFLQDLGA
jgi:hypothetical protein